MQGSYQQYFHTISPDNVPYNTPGSSKLAGLTINASKHEVLVGNVSHKFISCHSLDGTYLRSMKVTVPPWFLTVTSKGNIVVSPNGGSIGVQIIDEMGNVLSNLETPHGVSTLNPSGVIVSKTCYADDDDDEMFVANRGTVHAIYRYSTSGKYMGCVTKNVSSIFGLALSADENQLYAADYSSVKCFVI